MSERERPTDLETDEERFLQEFGPKLAALKAQHAQCPSLESILAAQSAALPEDVAAQIAGHLASCEWCRAIGNDWREFEFPDASRETARRIRDRVFAGVAPAARRPSQLVWRWVVPLGAVASLVLTFLLVRDARQTGSPPEATGTAPADQLGTPASAKASAGSPKLEERRRQDSGLGAREPAVPGTPSVFRLEKPPVRLPLSAAMVWRGEGDTDRARFAEEFKAAMVPYRADDYGPAAARLARLAGEFPDSPEVSFYLGVCQLFLAHDQDAIGSLGRAQTRATGDLAREVSWYLALAHQRTGQADRAEALLSGLCQGSNPYSAQACAGIQELKASRARTDQR